MERAAASEPDLERGDREAAEDDERWRLIMAKLGHPIQPEHDALLAVIRAAEAAVDAELEERRAAETAL